MKVLFDTSVVVYMLSTPNNLTDQLNAAFGLVEFITITPVIRELKGLKRDGRVASRYTNFRWDNIIEIDGQADDALVNVSVDMDMPVITLDLDLARRLKEAGASCYTLSGNKLIRY